MSEQVIQREKTPKKSLGERIFDGVVYGGIASVGAFVATIPFMYWIRHKGGQALYTKMDQSLIRAGLPPYAADAVMKITVSSLPGNLAIIPVRLAESHKQEIVTTMNKALGSTESSVSMAPMQEVHTGHLIAGRLTAWAGISAAMAAISKAMGGDRGFEVFENAFAKKVVGQWMGKPLYDHLGRETKWLKSGRIAAIDIFATVAGGCILYGVSHLPFGTDKKPEQRASLDPAVPASVVTQPQMQGRTIGYDKAELAKLQDRMMVG